MIASRAFAEVSGVLLVDGHVCSSSLADVRLSFYHKNVLFWLMPLSPKASCSIQWVSVAVFLSVKQNETQILCSLKSIVLVEKKIARLLKHNLTLNKTKDHLSYMAISILFRKHNHF